jgi:hypothetical protein
MFGENAVDEKYIVAKYEKVWILFEKRIQGCGSIKLDCGTSESNPL